MPTSTNEILVTGGAGYIGSHMVQMLIERGYAVVVLDDLSNGHRDAVPRSTLCVGSTGDRSLLAGLFAEHRFLAVMHFASFIQVGESVAKPDKYYQNNFVNALTLLDAMVASGVRNFIFSSTAAVFGEPLANPIPESHPRTPINPYGKSKWMVEQALADYERAFGLTSVSLRYFNAAGADPQARLGERHDPETHLIPLILRAATGELPHVKVFGRDYDTTDGTCVRDYVHIMDLCEAHLLALEWLLAGGGSRAFNLGNGNGFSVQEVIDAARRTTGRTIPALDAPRREGDPARLIADSDLARQVLGWRPRYDALETIIAHAWAWEQRRTGT